MKQRQLDEVALALAHSQAENKDQPDSNLLPALEIQLQIKEHEISESKAEAQRLREENQMLRSMTEQQRIRIDNMNVRMAELVSELHHTRENIAEFSMPRWPSQHSRHRSSSSSDGSPTDDIVRDAKRRIKTLEEEFEAIGRYHKNFQVRHMNESLMSSVLGSSSGQIFPPQPSPVHHFSAWTTEQQSSYLPQESSLSVRYEQMLPPSIPKLPKNQSPRQAKFVTKEVPKLVIETPRYQESNNVPLGISSSGNNASLPPNTREHPVHIEVVPKPLEVALPHPDKPSVIPDDAVDKIKDTIGPMGDAPLLEKPENNPIIVTSEDIVQTETGNIHISENVEASAIVNGHSEAARLVETEVKTSEPLVLEEKTEALNLELKSDYKLFVDPQVSSSSSSKHISAGLASPSKHEDDFWDL